MTDAFVLRVLRGVAGGVGGTAAFLHGDWQPFVAIVILWLVSLYMDVVMIGEA